MTGTRRRSAAGVAVLAAWALAAWGGASSAQPAPAAVRPNIVWISTEDMSPRLGAYGDSLARTPTLDRLAAESLRFTRAFTTAPVCAPSRAAIITGMYQTAIGAQHMRTTEDRVPELPGPYLAVPPFYVKAPDAGRVDRLHDRHRAGAPLDAVYRAHPCRPPDDAAREGDPLRLQGERGNRRLFQKSVGHGLAVIVRGFAPVWL